MLVGNCSARQGGFKINGISGTEQCLMRCARVGKEEVTEFPMSRARQRLPGVSCAVHFVSTFCSQSDY